VVGIVVGIASIAFFLIVEDMSLPMMFTDSYTLWFALIAVVQVIVGALSLKKFNASEQED
jgi:hypothetical protein